MSEKRFTVMKKFDGSYVICDNGKMLVADDCCDLLNEQQATITALKEENEKLRNIHLSIDLTYSYGYGRYLADVRVIDNE